MTTRSIRKPFTLLIATIAALALALSCSKRDDAQAFVGNYTVNIMESMTMFGQTKINYYNGRLVISKVSPTRVKVSGYLNTYGDVNGNTIYLEPTSDRTSDSSMDTVFEPGKLSFNVISFESMTVGQISNGRTTASMKAKGLWTAVKER